MSPTDLAENTGVSHYTLAEAVLLLEHEGLVARGGTNKITVRPISEPQVRTACFLREQTEVAIVRRAAATADTALLSSLRDQIVRQKLVSTRKPQDLLRLDDRFHRTLCDAAGHSDLWQQLERWKRTTDRVHFTMGTYDTSPDGAIKQHATIVGCLARRDAEGAAAATRYHLQQDMSRLTEYLRADPGNVGEA